MGGAAFDSVPHPCVHALAMRLCNQAETLACMPGTAGSVNRRCFLDYIHFDGVGNTCHDTHMMMLRGHCITGSIRAALNSVRACQRGAVKGAGRPQSGSKVRRRLAGGRRICAVRPCGQHANCQRHQTTSNLRSRMYRRSGCALLCFAAMPSCCTIRHLQDSWRSSQITPAMTLSSTAASRTLLATGPTQSREDAYATRP